MGAYKIYTGTQIDIDVQEDINDNGWEVSGNVAIHKACNQGDIVLQGFPYVKAVPNTFRYIISDYSSGKVNLKVGAGTGPDRTAAEEYTEIITPAEDDVISFFSDGNLSVKVLSISTIPAGGNGLTFVFDEGSQVWTTKYSWHPEFMLRFIDKFFCFKNGQIWLHNSNETRNNFFGVQHTTSVTFYVNIQSGSVKNFYCMRVNSNKAWSAPTIYIYPTEGKSEGMVSRLKRDNFKNIQGKFFAEFLRNMIDPRYNDQLEALFKGAMLQGDVMRITLENADTTEVRLVSVEVETDIQNYTL